MTKKSKSGLSSIFSFARPVVLVGLVLLVTLVISISAGSALRTSQPMSQPQQRSYTPSSTANQTGPMARPACPAMDITICGNQLRYKTQMKIKSKRDAERAFQRYANYMKANNLKDENLAADWQFDKAEFVGCYKSVAYWLITFHYIVEKDSRSKGSSQIYVNEQGDIVQLLGCM